MSRWDRYKKKRSKERKAYCERMARGELTEQEKAIQGYLHNLKQETIEWLATHASYPPDRIILAGGGGAIWAGIHLDPSGIIEDKRKEMENGHSGTDETPVGS